MHELAITQSLLSIVLEQANAVQAKKITKINLVIGEMANVVDQCVQFYFDFISKDSIAAEAALSFQQVPIQVRCRECAAIFSPSQLDWTCPHCHGEGVEVVAGQEFYIESIEVE